VHKNKKFMVELWKERVIVKLEDDNGEKLFLQGILE
jgi:hypothetical protein